jgi:hypothetical protein
MKEKTEKEKSLDKAIEEMENLLGGKKVCGNELRMAEWLRKNTRNYKGGIVYY